MAELLENADIPLNTKVNSILQIINVMKKQAEEKMKDNLAKQEEQNKLIETKKKQLKEVEDELNSLKQKIMTKNREYEFDEGRYRLMVYETNLLKQFLVCSLGLFCLLCLNNLV